jgi:hypothetical protein
MIGAGTIGIPSTALPPPHPQPQPADGIMTPRELHGLHVSHGLHVLHRRERHSPQLPTPHSQPVALAVNSATAARMRSLFMPVISVKDQTIPTLAAWGEQLYNTLDDVQMRRGGFLKPPRIGKSHLRPVRFARAATNLLFIFRSPRGKLRLRPVARR